MDALNPAGPAKDIVVVGRGKSELDAYLEKIAAAAKRTVVDEPTPEKGFYYRSDHFSFAKLGVPMFNFRSEEHTSELQSLMRISYAVFCLQKTKTQADRSKNE